MLNLHIKDPVLAPERRVAMEWEDAVVLPKHIVKQSMLKKKGSQKQKIKRNLTQRSNTQNKMRLRLFNDTSLRSESSR